MPDLIPLPYHSSVVTSSNSEGDNTERGPPQSPVVEADDMMTIDHPLGSIASDFIFPCQPDAVRISG